MHNHYIYIDIGLVKLYHQNYIQVHFTHTHCKTAPVVKHGHCCYWISDHTLSHQICLKAKSSVTHTHTFWLWRYLLTSPSLAVGVHGDHRSLFVLCVMAQWMLGRSAMINSGKPQGRAARPGYAARDLVSSRQPRPRSSIWPAPRPELAASHTCHQNRVTQTQFEERKSCEPLWHVSSESVNMHTHARTHLSAGNNSF